ncbi:TonB-dependent receptor plug domain-containing protein [Sphingomonas histidinilytica]|uniref:TonB-dependent receptor n=1 Tax=Rhizorhabdus histidinilytica TaxID=439228 RepID=UPI001ADA1AF7|nr:TonB-dependent receptor [Rhizorhabdus histidinilytica]MBO9378858.1 TonB-dependent receptor plug domain-containing protein [Rhizorhabdus histidinilytica]
MSNSFCSIGCSSLFALAAALACSPAHAQSAAPDAKASGVGEIVVTAQRREQKLQDVGVSVLAASGEELRAAGVVDSKDIAKIAAGVVFDSTAGGSLNANLTIRGVAQSDFSAFQESPNSVYIDDVYLASSAAAAFSFYDLARIEVLRGPQGTLFGKASSGGLANFISQRPTDQLEGYAEAGIGRFDQLYFEGAISGPISDRVRARLSGRVERADGWFRNENVNGRDTFETRNWGVRGQIEADLTDNLEARLQVSYDKSPRHAEGTYKVTPWYYDADGQPQPLPADVDYYGTGPGNDIVGYRDTIKNKQAGSFNNDGFLEKERFSPTMYLVWKGDNFSVTSISNYTKFKINYREDCDGTPVNFCLYDVGQNLDQYSQELRINGDVGPLNYTAGIYYLNVDQLSPQRFAYFIRENNDFAYDATDNMRQKTKDIGIFGHIEYELSRQFKVTVGARWTRTRKEFDSTLLFTEAGNGPGLGSTIYSPPLVAYEFNRNTAPDQAIQKKSMWSGKAQIDYKPNDDVLLYASVSRGVKGPGFNANLGGLLTFDNTGYRDEHVWAYEGGAKLRLFNGRATLNTGAFYYDYHNFQGFGFIGISSLVGNYASTFYGLETELNAKLPFNVDVRLGAAYLHTKVKDVQTAYNGVRDQESVGAPKWQVNGNITKTFELGDDKLMIGWSFDYVDDRYSSIDNNAATFVPGSFVHDARITYRMPDKGLELSAFVNNISDTDRMNFVFDYIHTTGSKLESYAKPRWWGVSVRKEF